MPREQSPPKRVPRVLVLYGTTEGHSAKVAAAVGDNLRGGGLNVEVVDAAGKPPQADAYDAVVIVASVHRGDYQPAVVDWTRSNARTLNTLPTAFVSVSLGVLQTDPKVQQESAAIVERFLERTGWTPTATTAVAGALMYRSYNFMQRMLMKRIAAQAGGDTDTSRNHEYTDWKALGAFVRRFRTRIRA
jgi:menaquinone-dependent protoporphyrinogen oxidase